MGETLKSAPIDFEESTACCSGNRCVTQGCNGSVTVLANHKSVSAVFEEWLGYGSTFLLPSFNDSYELGHVDEL